MRSVGLRSPLAVPGLFLLILGAALSVFWPGLSGPFVFDDIPNLKPLGYHGGVVNLDNFIEFVFNGKRVPGRSLTYLSFLLNDVSWPSNPWPFKYTNLLLHLLNGVLVFILARRLLSLYRTDPVWRDYTALAVMAVWVLHPIHLSTMMLVIQRLVELMSLFVLLGLVAYLKGRTLVNQRPLSGYMWMSAGVGACGILAVLGKENGILLSLYIAVVEYAVVRPAAGLAPPRYWRLWATVFIIMPLAFLAAYIIARWDISLTIYETRRAFSPLERIMTEPRILLDYLYRIFSLRMRGSGLFHDDYPFSTGLFTPPTTLLSITLVAGALAWALIPRFRYRFPLLAFAILWFLAGHAIESTFLHLELYFEHRNYLPMLGPLLALVVGLLSVRGKIKRLTIAALVLFIGLQAVISWQSAAVWGDRALFANILVRENPTSQRARQQAADFWLRKGRVDRALEHLRAAAKDRPNAIDVRFQSIYLQCLTGELPDGAIDDLLRMLTRGNFSFATLSTIDNLRDEKIRSRCTEIDLPLLQEMLDRLLENEAYTRYAPHRSVLYYTKGIISSQQRQLNPAMHYLDKAYEADPSVDIALQQVTWLLNAGLPDDAERYLERAKRTQEKLGYKAWFTPSRTRDIRRLEKTIERMRAKQGGEDQEQAAEHSTSQG